MFLINKDSNLIMLLLGCMYNVLSCEERVYAYENDMGFFVSIYYVSWANGHNGPGQKLWILSF